MSTRPASSTNLRLGQSRGDMTPAPPQTSKMTRKLTWIHLRYYPPALILQIQNISTKSDSQKVIDLLDFNHDSNLEETAQTLMNSEVLLTRHNLPTLLHCLQKLRRRSQPDATKRFALRRSVRTHVMPVLCACLSRDGTRFATGSFDKTCKVWNASTTDDPVSLGGHFDAVHCCLFNTESDKVLTGSYDGTVRLYDLPKTKEYGSSARIIFPVHSFHGAQGEIEAIDLSSSGHLAASGATDNVARVYDLATAETLFVLEGHDGIVANVQFDPEAKTLLTGSIDRRLGLWDLRTGSLTKFLEGHSAEVMACSYDFFGQQVISGGVDKVVNVWDLRQEAKPVTVFSDNTDEVWTVKFNSRGNLVASGAKDGRLVIWNLKTDTVVTDKIAHDSPLHHLSFNAAGTQLITCSEDASAKIWMPNTGEWIQDVEGHGDKVLFGSFSYLGDRILTVGDNNFAHIWE